MKECEKIAILQNIAETSKDYKSPHFWQDVQTLGGLDYLVTVVIMPMRG